MSKSIHVPRDILVLVLPGLMEAALKKGFSKLKTTNQTASKQLKTIKKQRQWIKFDFVKIKMLSKNFHNLFQLRNISPRTFSSKHLVLALAFTVNYFFDELDLSTF